MSSFLCLLCECLRCNVGYCQGYVVNQLQVGILRDGTPEFFPEFGDFFPSDRGYTDE